MAKKKALVPKQAIDVPLDFVYAFVRQVSCNCNDDLLWLAAMSAASETGVPKEMAEAFSRQARSYKEQNSQWPKGFM